MAFTCYPLLPAEIEALSEMKWEGSAHCQGRACFDLQVEGPNPSWGKSWQKERKAAGHMLP